MAQKSFCTKHHWNFKQIHVIPIVDFFAIKSDVIVLHCSLRKEFYIYIYSYLFTTICSKVSEWHKEVINASVTLPVPAIINGAAIYNQCSWLPFSPFMIFLGIL